MKGKSPLSFSIILCTVACTSVGQAFFVSTIASPPSSAHVHSWMVGGGGAKSSITFGASRCLVAMLAKKRRRRRNDDTAGEVPQESDSLPVGDELPDFDLDSPDDELQQKSPSRQGNVNPNEITPLMMGDTNKAVRSVNELISDRSLETKFEFEEKEDPSVPDFTELARASSSSSSSISTSDDGMAMGKKKQRKAERRATAIESKSKEEEKEWDVLSNIPFLTNESGKVSPIKLLESGAWLGIFLLVAWEVYLNSPFFDRAAPMAPVIYELLM